MKTKLFVWLYAVLFGVSAMAGTLNLMINQVIVTDYC